MKIYYAETGEDWRKEEKFAFLERARSIYGVAWRELTPDENHTWLTEGLQNEFSSFIPMGIKKNQSPHENNIHAIFKEFSGGVKTNRDRWVYNFQSIKLVENVVQTIEAFNDQVLQWSKRRDRSIKIDEFIEIDDRKISWSEGLKNVLFREMPLEFEERNVRVALYRPFVQMSLYFDSNLNERRYLLPHFFPLSQLTSEDRLIWLKVGTEVPMFALAVNLIPDLLPQGGSQCFPFYVYDEDGGNRRENVTDWALGKFRERYHDAKIAKWDVFHYVYALLHHPTYRERYAANLKRELPRIPFAPDFWSFVEAGRALADLHVNYERQPEYPLRHVENESVPVSFRVEKMRLSKDKTALAYNKFLTLEGVPPQAFEYCLGNRSALEWVIDQYQVTTDKRSGIVSDPNREDDPKYVVRLVKQVTTVSVETVRLVAELPPLDA
jgi:predicted helicase